MIILLMLLFLVALQWVRIARREVHLLKYRYRLYALRDRLRRIAIEDARLGRSWLYPYLDSTISGAIEMLPDVSGWQALALAPVARARRERLLLVLKQLRHELDKPANVPFRDIYKEMWEEIASQLSDRHFVIRAEFAASATVFRGVQKLRVAVRTRERRSLESVLLREPKSVNRPSPVEDCALSMATS
jgi:hypothetical protein